MSTPQLNLYFVYLKSIYHKVPFPRKFRYYNNNNFYSEEI